MDMRLTKQRKIFFLIYYFPLVLLKYASHNLNKSNSLITRTFSTVPLISIYQSNFPCVIASLLESNTLE